MNSEGFNEFCHLCQMITGVFLLSGSLYTLGHGSPSVAVALAVQGTWSIGMTVAWVIIKKN